MTDTKHTDSVEATLKEFDEQFEPMPDWIVGRVWDAEDVAEFNKARLRIKEAFRHHLTTLQATTSQQVEEARDQEAKLWFETWYSHYIAPKQPLPGEFGKFATERIQMTGYQRDHALTPNHPD